MSDTRRLPDDLRLGPVRLQVSSLPQSLAFYENVLGLRVLRRGTGSAALGVDGGEEPLLLLDERPGAAPMPRRGRLGLYHFAILLPDRAALGRFVAHLAHTQTRAGASDHLVSEALYLTDPDGLGIEVYADRPRTAWQWRDGEIEMRTDPLDLDAVARAGAGNPWTGMPPGTRIGHLHLHVGAIDRAAGFYELALGLSATHRGYPGALFLAAGGYHHHLGVNTWAGEAAAPAAGDARLLEWTIVTRERSAAAAAARRVAEAGHPAEESPEGWLLTDPWGTRVRVRGEA